MDGRTILLGMSAAMTLKVKFSWMYFHPEFEFVEYQNTRHVEGYWKQTNKHSLFIHHSKWWSVFRLRPRRPAFYRRLEETSQDFESNICKLIYKSTSQTARHQSFLTFFSHLSRATFKAKRKRGGFCDDFMLDGMSSTTILWDQIFLFLSLIMAGILIWPLISAHPSHLATTPKQICKCPQRPEFKNN